MNRQREAFLWSVMGIGLVGSGCDSPDERVVRVATQAAERQAKQNEQMARLQEGVSQGARELVAAEAEAPREWVAMKHDVQQTMANVGHQRDALEAERRALALQRKRDPVVAKAIEQIGWVLVFVAPLGTGAYLYVATRQRADTLRAQILQELLVQHPAVFIASESKPQLERRESEPHCPDQDGSS